MKKTPKKIINLYLAFTKRKDRVMLAIEEHYTNPTTTTRGKLVQEISKTLKGSYSVSIREANDVIDFLDEFNCIVNKPEDFIDLDFDEATLLSILNKGDMRWKN